MSELFLLLFCCNVSLPTSLKIELIKSRGVLSFVAATFGLTTGRQRVWWPEWGSPGSPTEGLAHYPTDFTRDVQPVKCHSHNDYWRRIPLYDAIHAGCISIETDVWYLDNELFVGHAESALTPNRTFRSLYVDPLVDILQRQNPDRKKGDSSLNGVFDVDAGQTLVLLIDIKTDGNATFPIVHSQLKALRDGGYLTVFDGTKLIPGPITAVSTGDTPFHLVIGDNSYRDVFFDAPLERIPEKSPYDTTNSYYASASMYELVGLPWTGTYSKEKVQKIQGFIGDAHRAGLKARLWATPGWPVAMRNYVWELLMKSGADMLNVDDLYGATHSTWGKWE
jgi:hypothetical protein